MGVAEWFLAAPAFFPLERVLQLPLDARRWDWTQLHLVHAQSFRWDYGSTPFTNWQVIAIAWAAYFGTILLLKVTAPRPTRKVKTRTSKRDDTCRAMLMHRARCICAEGVAGGRRRSWRCARPDSASRS